VRRVVIYGLIATLLCALTAPAAEARLRSRHQVYRGYVGLKLPRSVTPSSRWYRQTRMPTRSYPGEIARYHVAPRLRGRGYECVCDCYPSRTAGVHVHVNILPGGRDSCRAWCQDTVYRAKPSYGRGVVIWYGY